MRSEGTFGISPSFLGLSQSSGQVTHVLLTRSRLCPRPKPGSSLHLHVLGTPPAFVLSQDQTLREELQTGSPKRTRFTKSRQGDARSAAAQSAPRRAGLNPGPVPVDQALAPREEAAYTAGLGRKTGSISCAASRQPTVLAGRAAASNLDTQSQPGAAEMVRMLLSFQRPPHLSGEVAPLQACAPGLRARGTGSEADSRV